jgi:hypothetical protein
MFRFTIRELLLSTIVVAMGTVLAVEHWPTPDGRRLTQKEIEVYSAALRFAVGNEGASGLIFISIAGDDPPRQLTGTILLPASQADVFAIKDHPAANPTPNERVRHKKTGEAGSIVTATIVQWLGKDRVKIKVESYTASLWAGGETIVLVLKDGEWAVESRDELWAS